MKKIIAIVCLLCLFTSIPCLAFEELSKGSKGDAVVELQNRLNELGYSVGNADGDFGGKTETALKQFQADNNLDATGIMDTNTYSALLASSTPNETKVEDSSELDSLDSILSQERIVDIWGGTDYVDILTDKGNWWDIYFNRDGDFCQELIASDIESVLGEHKELVLHKDGSIESPFNSSLSFNEEWNDIKLADSYSFHAVGLRNDNTWVSAGKYEDGQRDVENWTDIIDVQTGPKHTVGLKSDGTVIATGKNNHGQCKVSNWTDIIQISVAGDKTIGLRNDGTLVATGDNDNGSLDILDWKDVSYVNMGLGITVGITNEGKLLINENAQRIMKYEEEYRHIPSDYSCENAWKVYCSGSSISEYYVLLVKKDFTIELFGYNKDNKLDKIMDYINQSVMPTQKINTETEVQTTIQKSDVPEYNYTSEEFAELISKGINGTLTQEEAELLEQYYIYYK